MKITYCTACGSPVRMEIPADDDHERAVCSACGLIHYSNPKMVVGSIPEYNGRLLLCRRDIEPRKGFWTLPAGYLENGETVQAGAVRETLEETRARVELLGPFRMFNIVFVNQIYLMFRAQLTDKNFGPTAESSEVRLFDRESIPWDKLAFQVITRTLTDYFDALDKPDFSFGIFDLERGPNHERS